MTNAKAMKHVHRAMRLNSFGNEFLPWLVKDTFATEKIPMQGITSLLEHAAYTKPALFVVCVSHFWSDVPYANSLAGTRYGHWHDWMAEMVRSPLRHSSEVPQRVMHEMWILSSKLDGFVRFLEEAPIALRAGQKSIIEVEAGFAPADEMRRLTLEHHGEQYEMQYVHASLKSIGTIWTRIDNFDKNILTLLVEINRLLNVIGPSPLTTLKRSDRDDMKSFATNVRQFLYNVVQNSVFRPPPPNHSFDLVPMPEGPF